MEELRLRFFTWFVKGHFLPFYKLLTFAGLLYQINN